MLTPRAAGLGAAGLLAFTLVLPLSAQAQSFNCRYARSADEVAICQSDRLSALDQRMARLYSRVRNSLYGAERRELEARQREWLQQRHECGSDIECIADIYQQRIGELQNQ